MKILKHISGLAGATLASRILGMLRDIFFANFLGGGTVMSAFILAFTIPNVFRRLLGEGAIGTALIPLISRKLKEKNGRRKAGESFMVQFVLIGIILTFISVVISILSLIIYPFIDIKYVKFAFKFLPLIMPYAVFICLSGIVTSALNSVKQFFLPALTSLLLNIFLIFSLFLIVSKLTSPAATLTVLSLTVLSSGIIQLFLLMLLLKKEQLFVQTNLNFANGFKAFFNNIFKHPFVKEVWTLALPALISASALQISLIIDRTLAALLGKYAVPALYYSDRIVFISIGIFAVAMGSVLLPNMSSFATEKDYKGLVNALTFGLKHMLFICIPTAAFTFLFRREIIRILFLHGEFDVNALNATAQALAFYSLGIPFFGIIKIILATYYSQKNMKTPLKISIVCISINIILNLILMWPLQQGGIALATVTASITNNFLLLYFLKKQFKDLAIGDVILSSLKIIIAAGIASLIAYYTYSTLSDSIQLIFSFAVAAITFAGLYLLTSLALDSKELKEWLHK